MKPLVSVIIPVYNKVAFLGETLKSVLNQTYQNIEVIIVDDGSTDGSTLILDEFERRSGSNVKVFKQDNGGACHARNLGIKESTGMYIQFLDADDVLDVNKIANQVSILENVGDDTLVFGPWVHFLKEIGDINFERLAFFKDYEDTSQLLVDLWESQKMIAPFCWLTSRKIIERSEPWDESITLNQDGDYFSKIISNSREVVYVPDALGYYRKPENNNISTKKNRKTAESLFKTFVNYEKLIFEFREDDSSKIALIKNYEHFIYRMNRVAPDLCMDAFCRIRDLRNTPYPYSFSDSKLLFFSQFIGIKTSLLFKSFFNKFLK